uniref:Uncharacterized protein n=1 Tax=Hucho hucho TaxID=62062 RepID=A0A4W5K120_9TELE
MVPMWTCSRRNLYVSFQNAINDNIAEWKTEMAEKSQKLTQLKVDVATLKENIGKLKSQIVESPEEMKIQMEKMKENVKNIKLAIETADERLVGLQSNVQGVTHSEADIQLIFKLLQDLQSSMNKTHQHQEEVSTVVVRPNSTSTAVYCVTVLLGAQTKWLT